MPVIATLLERNAAFTARRFSPALKIVPSTKTIILGCLDPRVDPLDLFGLVPGEAAIIRNVGGRITPETLQTIAMLRVVSEVAGGQLGPGWNLVVLHHTDCGITRLKQTPDLLAGYFGVPEAALGALAVNDPYASVAVDIAALRASPVVPGTFVVTGLVYDVATGRVETVVPSAPVRA